MTIPFHVAIVEDDPTDSTLLQSALEKTGLASRIDLHASGDDFIKSLKEGGDVPDLVTLDMLTPGSSGLEVLETLHLDQAWSDIRAYILTDYDDATMKTVCTNRGALGYSNKPGDFEGLKRLWQDIGRAYDASL